MGNFGVKNSQTTSTTKLPSWLSGPYKDLIGGASTTASQPYTPYTGGFTPDQQAAFQHIGSMWGASNPAFEGSFSAANRAMVPTYETVGNYMNPYISNVIDATMANMQETNAQQQQGVLGDAIVKGAMGGNRVGVAQSELARQQKLANNQTLADLWSSGFQQAMGANQNQQQMNLQGSGALANLGQTQMGTNLSQAGAQLGAGTQQQQFDYQQYLNKLGFPYQQQSWLSGILGNAGSVAGGTTTEQKPDGNIFSQLLGGVLGISSLFKDGGVVPRHAASGGVMPYANDNAQWPGLAFGVSPYSGNDNGFGSYVPEPMQVNARGNFPRISDASGTGTTSSFLDPFGGDPAMSKGAENIKSWFSPQPIDLGLASGGVVPGYDAGGATPVTGWDRVVNAFGGALSRTPIGGAISRLAPEQWNSWGQGVKNWGHGGNGWANWQVPQRSNPAARISRPSSGFGSKGYTTSQSFRDWATGGHADGGVVPGSGSLVDNYDILTAPQEGITSTFEPRMPELDSSAIGDLIREYSGELPRLHHKIMPRIEPRRPAPRYHIPEWRPTGMPPVTYVANGGVIPRQGFAGGGMPGEDWGAFYGMFPGISGQEPALTPQEIAANNAKLLATTTDATAPIDGDRLGLGYGNGDYSLLPAAGSLPDASVERGSPTYDAPVANFDPPQIALMPPNSSEVPYTSGGQFVTQPAPGYSRTIPEAWKSLSEGKGLNLAPDFKQAMLAAGAAMMASKRPHVGAAIGEGLLEGNKVWEDTQARQRADAAQRAQTAQTGQSLAIQAQQAATQALIGQSTAAATRYTFKTTAAGVLVTDALNPSAPKLVPFGALLPNGQIANPTTPSGTAAGSPAGGAAGFDITAPSGGAIDPNLFSDTVAPAVVGRTVDAIDQAYPRQQSALTTNQQLAEMEHRLGELPETGWLAPGTSFSGRVDFAKAANTAMLVAGMRPIFPEGEIAAGEDIRKLTTRLGQELSQAANGASADIVTSAIEATPGSGNSREGARIILAGLRAMNQRAIDHYTFLQDWATKHSYSMAGAEDYFNSRFPPELYAMTSYVPLKSMQYLKQNPSAAEDFNLKYGNGKDVASIVLRSGV